MGLWPGVSLHVFRFPICLVAMTTTARKARYQNCGSLGNLLFIIMPLTLVSHVHQQNKSKEKAEALVSHGMGGPDDPPWFEKYCQQRATARATPIQKSSRSEDDREPACPKPSITWMRPKRMFVVSRAFSCRCTLQSAGRQSGTD